MKNRGFTLVEAMICLVVIGLLLGGVLKGYELINSGKTMALSQRVSSLRNAWHIFVDRYGWVPGDYPQASDFISSDLTNGNGSLGFEDGESAIAMSHLVGASLIKCAVCTSTQTGVVPTLNDHPGNQFGGVISFFAQGGVANNYADTPYDEANREAISLGRGVPQTILAELDRKLDDGEPHRGLFRAAAGSRMESVVDCVAFHDPVSGSDSDAMNLDAIYSQFANSTTPTSLVWRTTSGGDVYRIDSCLSAHLL